MSVLVVGAGGIGPILLLLFSASGLVCITKVDHEDVEVSNLHWKVIHTKEMRGTIKARYTCDTTRDLNPTVLVTAVTDPLTCDNDMVVGAGGIGPILLLLFSASGLVCITKVDHEDVEVSNLHWKVIHTKEMRGTIKARYTCDTTRDLNPTVLVTAVTDPLACDNDMNIARGNGCMVDTGHNPCTRYLINNNYVLSEREPNTAVMTNGVIGRRGVPILLVSGSDIGNKGKITVYNHQGGCVCVCVCATDACAPSSNLGE